MNPVVVMVTVAERAELLNNFLQSLKTYYPDLPVALHVQGPVVKSDFESFPKGLQVAHYRHSLQPLGCHAARIELLRDLEGMGFDTYVNVDDDVELTPDTHWKPAMNKAHEPGVGFVLTNWVRHSKAYPAARERMSHTFKPQIMVYNGGGMAYSEETAKLIRPLEAAPARYDDLWPLTAYIDGRRNYRYLGSLAIHRIMSKGGMSSFMRTEPRPLLAWDHVQYRYLSSAPVGTEYSIPSDSDVRPETKAMHRAAREAKGWPVR